MNALPQHLAIIALLHVSTAVDAQRLLQDYDSLPLTKPKPSKPTFVFPSPGIGTASLVHNTPFSTELPPKKKKFEGLLTVVTGIGTGTSYSSNYLGIHEINLSDPLKSWRVHMYCKGTSSTERERVKNDDGSFSIDKTTSVSLDWSSGAQGFLLEQSDTVGVFLLIVNPASDEQLAPWLKSLERQYDVPAAATEGPAKYYFPFTPDYAVYGQLRDKFFYIVASGRRWVSLILLDDKPAGIFQSDFNDVLTTTKKWRVAPYVLIDKSLDEAKREDVERLAMMGWLTTRAVGRSN